MYTSIASVIHWTLFIGRRLLSVIGFCILVCGLSACVSKKKYDELAAAKNASDQALAETQADTRMLEERSQRESMMLQEQISLLEEKVMDMEQQVAILNSSQSSSGTPADGYIGTYPILEKIPYFPENSSPLIDYSHYFRENNLDKAYFELLRKLCKKGFNKSSLYLHFDPNAKELKGVIVLTHPEILDDKGKRLKFYQVNTGILDDLASGARSLQNRIRGRSEAIRCFMINIKIQPMKIQNYTSEPEPDAASDITHAWQGGGSIFDLAGQIHLQQPVTKVIGQVFYLGDDRHKDDYLDHLKYLFNDNP